MERFCIQCGRPFEVAVGDESLCSDCGGGAAVPLDEELDADGLVLIASPAMQAPVTSAGRSFPTGDSVPPELRPGDVLLDLYEVTGMLGEGGMGKVYRVHHRTWGLDLALKSPQPGVEGFATEAEAWVDLGLHPHIVTCHYVRRLGGIPRVFAELVDGGSLKECIEGERLYEGTQSEVLKRILDVAIQFAWGLGYAHERRLVHQDVKPGNVLLSSGGVVKVTDFGLMDRVGGTRAYLSPEQADALEQRASPEVLTGATDVWSWALSVLDMFTGEARPDRFGQAGAGALQSVLERGPGRAGPTTMPPSLAELLGECFQTDPDERPNGFEEIAERLVEIYRDETGEAHPREQPSALELRADALNNRALSFLDLGRESDATAAWEEALGIDPHHAEATYNYGLLGWRRDGISDAEVIRRVEAVGAARRDSWLPHYLSGWVHLERGSRQGAMAAFREAEQRGAPGDVIDTAVSAAVSLAERRLEPGPSGNGTPAARAVAHPDGSSVVTIDRRGGLSRWDLAQGSRTLVLPVPEETELASDPPGLAVTPDGRLAVSGDGDNGVRVWDLESGELLRRLEGHRAEVTVVVAVTDSIAVTGSSDWTARVWNVESGFCHGSLKHQAGVASMELMPDGYRLVSGDHWGVVWVWDLESGTAVAQLHGHDEYTGVNKGAYSIACFADGRHIATGGGYGVIRMFDVDSEECVQVIDDLSGSVRKVLMDPGERWLIAADENSVRIYDVGSGSRLRTVDRARHPVLSPNGQRLLVIVDDLIQVWDLETLHLLTSLDGHDRSISVVGVAGDGTRALSSDSSGTMLVWDLGFDTIRADWALTRPKDTVDVAERAGVVSTELGAARQALAAGQPARAAALLARLRTEEGYENDPELLDLWHRAGLAGGRRSGLCNAHCVHTLEEGSSSIDAIAVAMDAGLVMAADEEWKLRVWDLASGELVRNEVEFPADSLALSRREDLLVRGSWDHLDGWDLEVARRGELDDEAPFVAISLDGRRVLAGGANETVRLWDPATGELVADWSADAEQVTAVALSPDATWGLVGENDMTIEPAADGSGMMLVRTTVVSRVDFAAGEATDFYASQCIDRLLISGDGRRGVFMGLPGIEVWDLVAGERLIGIAGGGDIAVCGDDRFAVTGHGTSLRVLDLETGETGMDLTGHIEGITRVAITPDGRIAVSGGEDGIVKVWQLDWDYEFPDPADSDDSARPYLEQFLIRHTPYGRDGVARSGVPTWDEGDVARLLTELGWRGFGWLRPEGVRAALEALARERRS